MELYVHISTRNDVDLEEFSVSPAVAVAFSLSSRTVEPTYCSDYWCAVYATVVYIKWLSINIISNCMPVQDRDIRYLAPPRKLEYLCQPEL